MREKCFLTGTKLEKAKALRFTISPKREIVPDCYNKLSGRGVWVKPEKKILELLTKSDKLPRYFGGEVFVDPDISLLVKKLLMQKILKQLSLARKAGLLVIGSDSVKNSFNTDRLRLVIAVKGAKKIYFSQKYDNEQIF